MEKSGQLHAPVTSPPGKEFLVTSGYEAGYASELDWMRWRGEKSCLHRDLNYDPSTIQPIAGRYTDCITLANVSAEI
jgi:hypothetical protein